MGSIYDNQLRKTDFCRFKKKNYSKLLLDVGIFIRIFWDKNKQTTEKTSSLGRYAFNILLNIEQIMRILSFFFFWVMVRLIGGKCQFLKNVLFFVVFFSNNLKRLLDLFSKIQIETQKTF